jgi:hypothetical protein
MSEVHAIFDAFGGPTPIAKATGFPVQTVCDWRKKGDPEIPPWRRPAVLDAAKRLDISLPPEAIAYLASSERPKAAA